MPVTGHQGIIAWLPTLLGIGAEEDMGWCPDWPIRPTTSARRLAGTQVLYAFAHPNRSPGAGIGVVT